MVLGGAHRQEAFPNLRFAIAKAPCERGCVPCARRVGVQSQCLASTTVGIDRPFGTTFAFARGCFDGTAGFPTLPDVFGPDHFTPDGRFDPFKLFGKRKLPSTTPQVPSGVELGICVSYKWLFPVSEVFIKASELRTQQGDFVAYLIVFEPAIAVGAFDGPYGFSLVEDWPFTLQPSVILERDAIPIHEVGQC